MAKKKTILLNGVLLVISIVLVLVLAEVGYRVYVAIKLPPAPEEAPGVWSCYDEVLGWTHIPGAVVKKVVIDRYGARAGNEEEIENPLPGRLILAFGDSFTFGDELHGSHAWPYLLNEKTGKRGVGVLNMGVCAYGIGQMYLRYREEAEKLRPEIVLAGIISWDIQRVIKSRWKEGGRHKPRFVYRDGDIHLEHVPVPRETKEDRQAAGWADILFDTRRLYLFDRFFPPEDRLWKSLPEIPDPVYPAEKIPRDRYAEGVLLSQKIIERWKDDVESSGGKFILVLMPLKDRVRYYHSYLVTLRDNLARQGVEIVDCQPAFQEAEAAGQDLFGGAHPSAAGQEVIAGQVYYYLVSTGAI